MNLTTINVAIALGQIFQGAPVGGASVRFELTGADVEGSTLVLPKPKTVVVDEQGVNLAEWWTNAAGSLGTQTKVTIRDADGVLQFEGLATFPAYDCDLTEALQLLPSGTVTEAQQWALKARDWAIKPTEVEPGEDSAKTHALRAKADRQQADLDAAQTAQDRVATGDDVVHTDATKTYLDGLFSSFTSQLTLATAIMLGYAGTAQGAVSQAQAYAAQALAVVTQDLSGVSGYSLLRSPNTIGGSFPIDTTKDSDPTWMDRAGWTSWQQEAASAGVGPWVNAANGIPTEVLARALGGTLGANVIASNAPADWTPGSNNTLSVNSNGGVRAAVSAAQPARMTRLVVGALTPGKVYALYVFLGTNATTGGLFVRAGSSAGIFDYITTNTSSHGGVFKATTADLSVDIYSGANGPNIYVDQYALVVREVTAWAPSGAYYNNGGDGKCYRVWKNVMGLSEFPTGLAGLNVSSGGQVTASAMAGYDGAIAIGYDVTGINQQIATKLVGTQFQGLPAVFSCVVQMDDGNAPALGSAIPGNALNDFRFTLGGNNALAPNTATIALVSGSQYRVSIAVPTIGAASSFGIVKDPTNSNRTFKTSGWSLIVGTTVFDTYEKKTTADTSQTEVFRSSKAKIRRGQGVWEATRLTIFDLDEPGRPMWKVFKTSSAANLNCHIGAGAGLQITGVVYREGKLYVATSAQGLRIIDLANDRSEVRQATGSFYLAGNLAQCNTEFGYTLGTGPLNIVSSTVNGLAVTVPYDAPRDPVTGLKNPLVALAQPGVSILKPDGTVATAPAVGTVHNIYVTPEIVAFANSGGGQFQYAEKPSTLASGFTPTTISTGQWSSVAQAGFAGHGRASFVRRSGASIGRLRLNAMNPAASLTADVGPYHSTGWMPGSVAGAWLSDTDAGVVPSAPVASDDFSGGVAAWPGYFQATVTDAGAKMRVAVGTAGSPSRASRGFATVIGRRYRAVADVVAVNANGGGAQSVTITASNNADASGPFSVSTAVSVATPGLAIEFTASATTTYIGLTAGGTGVVGSYADWDNFLLQQVVADRSYRAAPLYATGTVQKTPVASLAQLVAFYGFTANDYLRQPYNVALDFGTGGFVAVPWVSIPTYSTVGFNSLAGVPYPLTPALSASFADASAELITNGSPMAAAGWTVNAGWNFAGGVATHTPGNTGTLEQNGLVSSSLWRVIVTVAGMTAGTLQVGGNTVQNAATVINANGTYSFAVAPNGPLLRLSPSTTFDGGVSLVSVKEIAPAVIMDRSGAAGAYWRLAMDAMGRFVGSAYDGATLRTVTSAIGYGGLGWVVPELSLTASGALTLKVNGAQVAQTTGVPLASLNNAAAVLTVGNNFAANAPFPGSIALARVGASVPTDEQSRRIYDDEKGMFAPGAQVTLPDAGTVLDVAYDAQSSAILCVSAANEATFSGFIRTATAPCFSGSLSKIAALGGVKITGRSLMVPGADVTVPARNLREDLDLATRPAANDNGRETFEYLGGFTGASTLNSPTITSANYSIPAGANIANAQLTASTAFAGTRTVLRQSGSSLDLDAVATATSAVTFSLLDYILPMGWEPKAVSVTIAGATKRCREGSTLDYVVLFDGDRYRVRFITAPGATAVVTIDARYYEALRKAA